MIGSRNAAVFPLPVCAQAITSRPRRAGGMASAWIGVARTNPSSLIALTTAGFRFSCVKGTTHYPSRTPPHTWPVLIHTANDTWDRIAAACRSDSVRRLVHGITGGVL